MQRQSIMTEVGSALKILHLQGALGVTSIQEIAILQDQLLVAPTPIPGDVLLAVSLHLLEILSILGTPTVVDQEAVEAHRELVQDRGRGEEITKEHIQHEQDAERIEALACWIYYARGYMGQGTKLCRDGTAFWSQSTRRKCSNTIIRGSTSCPGSRFQFGSF